MKICHYKYVQLEIRWNMKILSQTKVKLHVDLNFYDTPKLKGGIDSVLLSEGTVISARLREESISQLGKKADGWITVKVIGDCNFNADNFLGTALNCEVCGGEELAKNLFFANEAEIECFIHSAYFEEGNIALMRGRPNVSVNDHIGRFTNIESAMMDLGLEFKGEHKPK